MTRERAATAQHLLHFVYRVVPSRTDTCVGFVAGTTPNDETCTVCWKAVRHRDALRCCECESVFHYLCYRVPTGMFPNRLRELVKPFKHTYGDVARYGDTRRADFRCPRCNFHTVVGRSPVMTSVSDAQSIMCDVRATLDEFISDSSSYSQGCMYALRRATRFGDGAGIPLMIAHDPEELFVMNARLGAVGHLQLRWFLAWRTRSVSWDTAKKERSAIYNFYERMGVRVDDIPTATHRFKHFMGGMLQRKGESTRQCKTFDDVLIEDMCTLLRDEFRRAKGRHRVHVAKVQLAWHAYMQVGARANELFEQTLGDMKAGFCFGDSARRKRIMPHMKFKATLQTKENRCSETLLWCAATTKRDLLASGPCAELVVAVLAQAGVVADRHLVFSDHDGAQWRMGVFWAAEIRPRLEQLQREGNGGLENEDLSLYGSNSFRRTWTTLALQNPDPVREDLVDRQGRWRKPGRAKGSRMQAVYNDPRPRELLLATCWL